MKKNAAKHKTDNKINCASRSMSSQVTLGVVFATQDAPKTAQDAPKTPQDAPKRPQDASKRLQDTPKRLHGASGTLPGASGTPEPSLTPHLFP